MLDVLFCTVMFHSPNRQQRRVRGVIGQFLASSLSEPRMSLLALKGILGPHDLRHCLPHGRVPYTGKWNGQVICSIQVLFSPHGHNLLHG